MAALFDPVPLRNYRYVSPPRSLLEALYLERFWEMVGKDWGSEGEEEREEVYGKGRRKGCGVLLFLFLSLGVHVRALYMFMCVCLCPHMYMFARRKGCLALSYVAGTERHHAGRVHLHVVGFPFSPLGEPELERRSSRLVAPHCSGVRLHLSDTGWNRRKTGSLVNTGACYEQVGRRED